MGPVDSSTFSGCTALKRVTILGGTIGSNAFKNLTGLRSVTIAEGVTEIGEFAFDGCYGLTGTLAIPNSVTNIGRGAFRNCTGLTGELMIPEGVKTIGGGAYYYYEDFYYENGSTFSHDRYGAFQNCIGLTAVSLPTSIETIDACVFSGDTGIKTVTLAEGSTVVGGFDGCTGLTEMVIPNSVTNIGNRAFLGCTELVNVNMPTSLKSIGHGAFNGCHKLLKLEWLPGVTVGAYAFAGCSSWQGVFNVPEGVTEIAAGVFSGCSGLQQINLPDGITTIGANAFFGCSSLAEMILPDGLTSIESRLFSDCYQLRTVVIPNTVKSIGDYAFYWCKSLTDLKIPFGVTTLGFAVFCISAIETITVPSSLVNVDRYAFDGWSGSQLIFEGDLPVGYELWVGIDQANVTFTRASGGRGLVTWPVTQFMGYVQENAPKVTIISSKIRENDPEVMDVVYKVTSVKPTVKVRALAFEDGVRSFANVVRPEDFIADLDGNETKGNVGDAVTANEEHTLSWKVSSDWATRLAKVSFEVLATEDDILPLELMTIPGTAAHPETWQVSWNYITADKSFEALLWLYADKDLGLTLQDGVLMNGDTRLCSGAGVSAYDALVYVYGKMGFQLLDGDALEYVKEATRFDLPDKSGRQYAYRVVTGE